MQFRAVVLALMLSAVTAFGPATPLRAPVARSSGVLQMGYVPDGLTPEQWAKEKKKMAPKSGLGRGGTAGMKFRSRSMEEFQKGREAGKLDYNMPVFNAKEKLRRGEITEMDIPYMQRAGGRPDNKDTKGGKDPMKMKGLGRTLYMKDGGGVEEGNRNKAARKWPWQK
eukprot:CAMPEP_0205923472 /NCGR_PEP_ID=MMETSP1325-20131115/16257_1 /ASSEMBLY_ACC=CAM_ASM_000708 /TAXON_ID=236786 /ORGANISM="Florenciella sp., Strain RCC1007" /LENGTH=167 /DNA_ID=CAMNT_0053291697 /DNA_START=62 /DNA_END=565 /DNA_ORIENTATION=+